VNLTPLVRNLSILTKDLQVTPLVPNWAQQEYLDAIQRQLDTTGRIRLIVLKARQLGISTITEAVLFSLAFVYERYKGMVIAHEIPASQNLLNMTKLYWDTYPLKGLYGKPKAESKNHIAWTTTGSSIQVSTAGNKATGRSATIHFLHASEVAFWPEASTVMLGLRQTIPSTPGTAIIMESTANGMGNYFHQQWLAAEAGDTEYEPLFFPWHRHPEYLASYVGLPYNSLGNVDSDEKTLRAMGLSDDRLAWRRWAIKNLCENDVLKFKQEYPATPEEAFIASGTNVFPHHALNKVFEPMPGTRGYLFRDGNKVTFKADPQGPMTVFRAPSADQDWGVYFVGGDPTHTTRGDFAVAQVINRRTLEQVAVWRGRVDPGGFAEELFKIGLYYNTATVTNEIEGPGYMTIGKLLGMNYPKIWNKARPDHTPGKVSTDQYGWSTTTQSKHLAMGWLLKVIMDESITIHDQTTYNEMLNYVTLDNGGYGPANEDGYDDTVMSLAITVTCHAMDSPVLAYGIQETTPDTDSLLRPLPWESWDNED
jgi:hypothetical protein